MDNRFINLINKPDHIFSRYVIDDGFTDILKQGINKGKHDQINTRLQNPEIEQNIMENTKK